MLLLSPHNYQSARDYHEVSLLAVGLIGTTALIKPTLSLENSSGSSLVYRTSPLGEQSEIHTLISVKSIS